MKKGKKLIAMLLGVLMLAAVAIGVVACGGSGNSASTETVGFFWYKEDDVYLTGVRKQVNQLFKGYNVKHFYAEDSQSKLQDLVAANIETLDVAVVNPKDPTNVQSNKEIVNKCKTAGIPCIFFNKEVPQEVLDEYEQAYYIGTIAQQAGEKQGEMMADFLIGTDGKSTNYTGYVSTDTFDSTLYSKTGLKVVYYAMVRGEEGHPEADARTYFSIMVANERLVEAGLILRPSKEMKTDGSLNVNESPFAQLVDNGVPVTLTSDEEKDIFKKNIVSNWSNTEAYANFKIAFTNAAAVTNKNNLGVIFCNNDNAAVGIVSALRDYGLNKANETDKAKIIPVVGVDGDDANLALINEGSMMGTVGQSTKAYAQLMMMFVTYLTVEDGFEWDMNVNSHKVFFNYSKIIKK